MLLKSGEAHLKAESMAREITELFESDISAFPSEDCRWLKSEFEANLDDLYTDLTMWFMTVAGYSSWGKQLLSWSEDKVRQVRDVIRFSFFDEYPQYKWLEIHITKANTPDLYEEFQLYEQLRNKLRTLLDFMLSEKYQDSTSQ